MPTFSKAKLVFFGNEKVATGVSTNAPVLRALIESGYEVVGLVVSQSETTSRAKQELAVVEIARKYNIPILSPKKVGDIAGELAELKAEAAVLVAFGQIVPQKIIDIFPSGIINIHPSLLPYDRGSSPIEEAILRESMRVGVSLMALTNEMDAGPLYAQTKIDYDFKKHVTKAELANVLTKLGIEMLLKNLDAILDGSLKPTPQQGEEEPQDESKMILSYTGRIKKTDGVVDFDKMMAPYIERRIRAYAGWPKSHAKLFGQDIIITKAQVAKDQADGGLVVKCMNDSYLEIQELTGPSGRTMSGADFIRGYKK